MGSLTGYIHQEMYFYQCIYFEFILIHIIGKVLLSGDEKMSCSLNDHSVVDCLQTIIKQASYTLP